MAKICLLTTGQPITNPRLVKEADALHEAGHDVRVICADYAYSIDALNEQLVRSKPWKCVGVGGHPARSRLRFAFGRARHALLRRLSERLPRLPLRFQEIAECRIAPELRRAARKERAQLYIAHNLGALPPAFKAARANGARLGFDMEDFHSGMEIHAPGLRRTESIERAYLSKCDYFTAAAPGIAEAYAQKYALPCAVVVENAFPLAERPETFRAGDKTGPLRLYWVSQTIAPTEGLEEILRALASLPDCNIELHLRGRPRTGYEARLTDLARELNVRPDRFFVHPPAPAPDMIRLAAEYDVGLALEQYVNPNSGICLSNKLYTYTLAGCAVLASRTPAQAAFVETLEGGGRTYEPGDVSTLAAHLRAWHDDRESLARARRAAWNAGQTRYNWDAEKQRLLQVVSQTLDSKRLPSPREN